MLEHDGPLKQNREEFQQSNNVKAIAKCYNQVYSKPTHMKHKHKFNGLKSYTKGCKRQSGLDHNTFSINLFAFASSVCFASCGFWKRHLLGRFAFVQRR